MLTFWQISNVGIEFVTIYALRLNSSKIQYTKQTKEINKHETSTY